MGGLICDNGMKIDFVKEMHDVHMKMSHRIGTLLSFKLIIIKNQTYNIKHSIDYANFTENILNVLYKNMYSNCI